MSKRFQNTSKFRNVVGRIAKTEDWYSDLQISTSTLSDNANLIQANQKWLAVKWSGNGGTLGILPLAKPGKYVPSEGAGMLHAHGAGVTDWSFSNFNQDILATGAEDGTVKVWKLPEEGITAGEQASTLSTLNVKSPRANSLKFHPTAENVLTTLGNNRKEVLIWDIGKEAPALTVESESLVHSFSWKGDGSLLATTGKDIVQVWDPRAEKAATQTGKGHEGIKGSRSVWLGSSNFILSTGLNKVRYRQYALWDARDLSKPIKMSSFDSSTGQLIPLYDEDTETVYVIGRGDSTIRSFQLSDLQSEPTIAENMACGTNNSLFGACLLPKLSLNVMKAEVARVMTLTSNAIVPVSFEVPRKQYLDFHYELFPDTKGNVPALSASAWLNNENGLVQTVSLDPSKRQAQAKSNDTKVSPSQPIADPIKEKSPMPAAAAEKSSPAASVSDKNDAISETPIKADSIKSSSNTSSPAPIETSPTEPTSTPPQQTPEATKTASSPPPAAKQPSEVASPTKVLPKYGAASVSPYKYIAGKPYHPSEHFHDLRGLSSDKSGSTNLIQASSKFIAVPIAGPGGRIGIISASKPGRLPTKVPSLQCGSSVVDFKFDPFNPNILVTASDDNKLRVWNIPDEGISEDVSEPAAVLSSKAMDKVVVLAFNPVAQDVLLTISSDRNNAGIRVWDLNNKTEKHHFEHGDVVFDAAWSTDGQQVATISKSKKIRIFDAVHDFKLVAEGPGHQSIRPAKLLWLGEMNMIASVGFGLGSSREVLVYKLDDLAKGPCFKKNIDTSPSVMSAYFDPDCGVLYVAGRGDRIIHTFELEESSLTALAKFESGTLQQGFAFLPKKHCNVKAIEIAKFYRLTATSIETVGIKVPRARPEFFQDDIFCPTKDVESPAQSADSWFAGETKASQYIKLQPDGSVALSEAPALPQTNAKKKFAIGKREASDDEKRKDLMQKMFASAKGVDEQAERDKAPVVEDEEKEVADDEWDD
ncbi:hypothetical protein BC943DRAFT_311248 [Umbelopsis sp. AD052]|nr:hypothetical protein BC943DRAFT_311248 [Umbelopsis sp. AD052]